MTRHAFPPPPAVPTAWLTRRRTFRPSPTLAAAERAIAALAAPLGRARVAWLKAGARLLLAEPWRLDRLFGEGAETTMPLLDRAAREIADLTWQRRAGFPVDAGRLMGLRQAALALRWRRRFG
ncbi:MAG: hypothetical protein U1E56_01225 [Bauldia sp.]